MKLLSFFFLPFIILVIAGCTNQSSDKINSVSTSPIVSEISSPNATQNTDYIGMKVDDAIKKAIDAGTILRVVEEDGQPKVITSDIQEGRINAIVQSGKIVSYSIEKGGRMIYDATSWKTIIDPNCKAFFDGCNTCNKINSTKDATCTKKMCEEYSRPECLDDSSPTPKIEYTCEGGNSFTVFYKEFRQDDAIMSLEDDSIMFFDHQTKTASLMKQALTGSGEKYSTKDGLVFWAKGESAFVFKSSGNVDIYTNCIVKK